MPRASEHSPRTIPDSLPAAPPTDSGTVDLPPIRASVWGRRQKLLLATACGLTLIDHFSFFAGFVTESPGFFIGVALWPPLVGSVRWPLVALSVAFGRRWTWMYALLVVLLIVYISNAVYSWRTYPPEYWSPFVAAFNQQGRFFVWTTLHMLLHASYWITAIVFMVIDFRVSVGGTLLRRGNA